METLQTECNPEEHTHIITDVRFRPNSTQLATSSFDSSVRLWDAAGVSFLPPMLLILIIHSFGSTTCLGSTTCQFHKLIASFSFQKLLAMG
jgi:WD40 repeat protein